MTDENVELVVSLASSGAAQPIRDVVDLQKAIKTLGRDAQNTQKLAQSLGTAFNLPDDQIADLAKAIENAREETETWRDTTGRLRDFNGRFISEARDGFEDIGQSAKGLSGIYQGIAQGVGQSLTSLATDVIRDSVTAVKDLGQAALDAGVQFDQARARVSTLTDDADGLAVVLEGVTSEVRNQVGTTELLEGSYDILSAGFTDTADAAAIAEASTRAAIGGFSEFGVVADATTSVLNAYGLAASEAESITDKFIATQNAGKITVDQYAQQIGKVAPLAAQAGVSLDELNGFIATATASGVQVESSFSGLRQALAAVLKPTSDAASFAEELGIQFDAAALRTQGLEGILGELNARGLDTPEILTRLFGSVEAVAAIAPSAGDGFVTLGENIEASVNSAGDATEAFDKVADSIPGLIQALQTQLGEQLRQIGTAFGPAFEGGLQLLSDIVTVASESSDGLDDIAEASERLKVALTENPELAERLGKAFAEATDAIVDFVVNGIESLAEIAESEESVDGFADAIETLVPVLQTAQGILEAFATVAQFAAENSEVLGFAIQVLAVRFAALKVQAAVQALTALAPAATAAAGGVGALAASTAAAAAPLAVLAAAVAAVKFNVFVQELRVANEELEIFAGNARDAATQTFAIARDLKEAQDEINAAQQQGVSISDEQIDRYEKQLDLAQQQLDAINQQLRDARSVDAQGLQEGAQDGLIQDLEVQRRALEKQIAQTNEALGTIGDAATSQPDTTPTTDELSNLETEVESATDRINAKFNDLANESNLATQQLIADRLEQGASAEEITGIEARALNDRIELNRQRLAELRAINQASLSAEDAERLGDEIIAVETELAKDRIQVARDRAAEQERLEQEAAKKREEIAKAEADAIKKAREEASQAAEQGFDDDAEQRQRQFEDAREQRQQDSEDELNTLRQQGQERIEAFKKQSQKQLQADEEAFQKRQQADEKAFQRELNAEREAESSRINAAASEAEFQTELQLVDSDEERQQLIEAREQAQRRAEILAEEQERALRNIDEGEQLTPVEQARVDLEDRIAARQQEFQLQQQAEQEAFEAQQQAQREADEQAIAELERQLQDELTAKQRAFEESERQLERQFQDQQQSRERDFKAEQRRLDEESAQRIEQILSNARGGVGIDGARRDGGPVKAGGTYLVGEEGPELVFASKAGYVATARETAAMMTATRSPARISAPQASSASMRGVEQRLEQLIKLVESDRQVQAKADYTIINEGTAPDPVEMELRRISELVRRRRL